MSGASAHSDPDPGDQQLLSFYFYCLQEYQSTPGISKQVLFQIRPAGSKFWIACCKQAQSISALWLGQLAKSGQPQLAFQMCSTKSLTSVISSFSIKILLTTWSAVINFTIFGSIIYQPELRAFAWLEGFCLPCLRLNHCVGDRPYHNKPVGMPFKQMWKLPNLCRNIIQTNMEIIWVWALCMLCGQL